MHNLAHPLCEKIYMKYLNCSIGLIFALIFAGCTSMSTSTNNIIAEKPFLSNSQESSWSLMLGKWYGRQPITEDGFREQITERVADGTYIVTFRLHDVDSNVEEHIEVGNWGISGPVYFTIFRGWSEGGQISPSDPSDPYNYDPYNYDAYKIIDLNENTFIYESYSSGNQYTLEKVSNNYEFPD